MGRALLLAVALLSGFATPLARAQDPCSLHRTQPGWRVFVDRKAGFCLEYPSDYKRVRPMLNSRPCSVKRCLLSLEKNAPPSASPSEDDEYSNAGIELWNLGIPFRLSLLKASRPTGYEDPPDPVQFGPNTVYYYGRGGGGVTYADQFFFNVRGRAFGIFFAGPYMDGNEPDAVTKDIEARMLRSLRRF